MPKVLQETRWRKGGVAHRIYRLGKNKTASTAEGGNKVKTSQLKQSAALRITLNRPYPMSTWEVIEDEIADLLAQKGYRGSVENSVTGNSTRIRKFEEIENGAEGTN
jgi:hypothetical protein